MSRVSFIGPWRGRLLGISFVVLAFTAVPAGAAASPSHHGPTMTEHAAIRFQGSNGYRFEVQASAGRGSPIMVKAANGPDEVRYVLLGSLDAGGSLDVHLPHVGRIAVKFDQTMVTRKHLPLDCKGHRSIVASGVYRGSIELHGERGFTTVDRSSARGRLIRSPRKACNKLGSSQRRPSPHRNAEETEATTALGAGPRQGSLNLTAAVFGSGTENPSTLVVATKTHFRKGGTFRTGMLITNSVFLARGSDGLIVRDPDNPKVVELTPPAPFEGSATFRLTSPKTSTWRGDLAIELPGVGRTRLAGKSFESTLCEGSHCTNTASEELKLLAKLSASLVGLVGALPG